MIISPRVQKLLAAQRTAANYPYLIKITHNNIDYYYVNSPNNILYGGDIYNAASFSIRPPDYDGSKIGNATLTISTVDQFWIQKIRESQIPARIKFVAIIVYEDGNTNIESLEENSFTLRSASWDEISVSWEMSFDERQTLIITSVKCTPQIAPGCA